MSTANTIFRIQVAHKVLKNNNSDITVVVFKLCSLQDEFSTEFITFTVNLFYVFVPPVRTLLWVYL